MKLQQAESRLRTPVTPTERRRGFTLVELLVVLVIIGILAALLLPVIGGAMRKARVNQVQQEMTLIETALTEFKSTYGVFPPSRIHLHEDPVANPYDLAIPPNTTPLHAALDRRTVQFFKRMWPKFNVLTTRVDWNGNNQFDQGPNFFIDLNGSECLVFFLGGMPLLAPGNVRGTEGFSLNPTYPFSRSTNDGTILQLIQGYNQRRASLLDFQPSRLTDLDGDLFWEYYDPVQEPPQVSGPGQFDAGLMPHPYAYFSGYDGQGYNWLRLPNGIEVTYDNAWPGPNNTLQGLLYPFSLNLGAPSVVKWWNEKTYQLISPGVTDDGLIGHGMRPDPANVPNAVAVFNPDNAAFDIDQELSPEAHDNITNFSGGQLSDVE